VAAGEQPHRQAGQGGVALTSSRAGFSHWPAYPDVFSLPDAQPDPATGDHEDYSQEIRLKEDRGKLRLPAYVLIALGIAVVAVTVAILAVLVGFT
jgi:hypothetical protein